MWARRDDSICEPRNEASEEISLAHALTSDLWLLKREEMAARGSVTTASANCYRGEVGPGHGLPAAGSR